MKFYTALFILKWKQFLSQKNIIVLTLLLIISLYSVHKGTQEYINTLSNAREFQENEEQIFESISNYIEYSARGVKVIFVPSASSIFMETPVMLLELAAKVNTMSALNIYNNCKSPVIFKGNSSFSFRFSGIIQVLGNLVLLFMGFDTFNNKEFLKFLCSSRSKKMIHFTLFLAGFIQVVFSLLLIWGCCLGLVFLEKVSMTPGDLISLSLSQVPALAMLMFFFLIGSISGSLLHKKARYPAVLLVWFCCVSLYPGVINSIIETKTGCITSSYRVENKKLKIMNDFEKVYIRDRGSARNYTLEESREIIQKYLENEYKQIEAVDRQSMEEIESVIKIHNYWHLLMPTTAYRLACTEAGSRGYCNYLEYYNYLMKLREQFVRFWINRVYYNDPKILVSFVKSDENLFKSIGRIPAIYLESLVFTMIYNIILFLFSYFTFKRSLYHLTTREIARLERVNLEMDPGDLKTWTIKGYLFSRLLYTILSGQLTGSSQKIFKGKVNLGGLEISLEKSNKEFLYICPVKDLPEHIKIKDMLTFYTRWFNAPFHKKQELVNRDNLKDAANKTIKKVKEEQAFELQSTILELTKSPIYLIHDIAPRNPISCLIRLKDRMDALAEKGAMVIYLTSHDLLEDYSNKSNPYFNEGDEWQDMVEYHRGKLTGKIPR